MLTVILAPPPHPGWPKKQLVTQAKITRMYQCDCNIAKCLVQSLCSNVAPWENMLFLLAYAKTKVQSNRTVDQHHWFLHIDSTILQHFKPSVIFYGWKIGLMCQTLKTGFLTTRLMFYLINDTPYACILTYTMVL